MKNTQIVHKLHVSLLKVKAQSKFFSEKVQCVERFGLCFGDGRDVRGTWKALETRKGPTRVLYDEFVRLFIVVKQRTIDVFLVLAVKTLSLSAMSSHLDLKQ